MTAPVSHERCRFTDGLLTGLWLAWLILIVVAALAWTVT